MVMVRGVAGFTLVALASGVAAAGDYGLVTDQPASRYEMSAAETAEGLDRYFRLAEKQEDNNLIASCNARWLSLRIWLLQA